MRKCHAMLFFENLYEPKVDVIFTISFKMTAETCFASYFADELYRLCMGYVFHCHEMGFHCFLPSIARFFLLLLLFSFFPGGFDMLQYFETILPSVESLLSSYQDEVYFMVWWGSWRRVTSSTMGTILDFTKN